MTRRLALLCSLAVLASPLAPVAAAPAVPLAGTVPVWAVPAARVGAVPADEVVQVQVLLPWRDARAAHALALAVSDPANPAYGRHLTPAQWRDRFAPATATVDLVTTWLRARGLEVGAMPANRLFVPARGRADVVAHAFGTTLSRYAVDGHALRAPDSAPRLPANLARVVAGVRGLDQGAALIRTGPDDPPPPLPQEPATPADVAPPPAVVYGAPCSAYDGATVDKKLPKFRSKRAPAVACATSPQTLRDVYGVTPLLKKKIDGSGQTVVMIGSHAIKPLPGDISTWSKRHGIPPLRDGQLNQISYPGAYQTPVAEPYLRPSVWAVQASTLLETVHALAPGANLVYVGTTSSLDLMTGTLLAVDGGWGDAVINGWYTTTENVPEPEWTLIDHVAEQAAATGISLLFAAGDLGDNSYTTGANPTTVYPASEPMATSVGATSLILGRKGKYVRELAWGKAQLFLDEGVWEDDLPATYRGTGGGTSSLHDQPAYQVGVVPKSLAARDNGDLGRTVPDLAVLGDAETAMAIGYTQRFPDGKDRYSERRIASSTASAALVAALLVLANDRRGTPLGFANPALYAKYRAKRSLFRDVVRYGRAGAGVRVDFLDNATPASGRKYVLKVFEEWGENVPRRGYDTAAGLGTPTAALLAVL